MRRFAFVFFLLFFSLLSFFSLSAFSQAKHPFTFEDMMKLKRVGEPVPSPDGKWVLFAAVDVDLAANKKTSHIWIVPLGGDGKTQGPSTAGDASPSANHSAPVGMTTSGGAERVLIADQDGDRPRWAPDGKRFAFISNKEGGSQVWIAEFDGAAGAVSGVHKLTSIATEAGGELWSPDGKNILFTSDVYPECDGPAEAEADCNARKLKEVEESKVKGRNIYSAALSTLECLQGRQEEPSICYPCSSAAADNWPNEIISEVVGGPPRDLTPGDYDSPVFSLGGQDNYAFSPDAREICYTSNHDKVEATSTNNDLWIVPVNLSSYATPADVLAKTKNITADNPASDSTPLYSPDGKYIAYRAQQRPGYESDRFRLMLYDRKTGEKKNLTEDFDRSGFGTMRMGGPIRTTFYFSAENGGQFVHL